MPKLLAGCHYNEEEISWHLKKSMGYWPVQMNGNKFATSQILEKPVEIVEGADFSWLSSKVTRTLLRNLVYLLLDVCLIHEELPRRNRKLDFSYIIIIIITTIITIF